MAKNTLRVRARGTALVQDYLAMDNGVRRYIGRKLGTYVGTDHEGKERDGASFNPTGEIHEVPPMHEYVRHVQHGDLWAADQETADRCGVPFDPTFGAPPSTETKPGLVSLSSPMSKPADAAKGDQ